MSLWHLLAASALMTHRHPHLSQSTSSTTCHHLLIPATTWCLSMSHRWQCSSSWLTVQCLKVTVNCLTSANTMSAVSQCLTVDNVMSHKYIVLSDSALSCCWQFVVSRWQCTVSEEVIIQYQQCLSVSQLTMWCLTNTSYCLTVQCLVVDSSLSQGDRW